MATTRQPLKRITDAVSPVHRLRLTVSRGESLWHYQLDEDSQPAELQQIKPNLKTPNSSPNTAIIYAAVLAMNEVGIDANFIDFTTDADCTIATIEVLAIEGKNILVQHADDPGRFYHADSDALPIAIAKELAETIRGMAWGPCDGYVARNGRVYRWGSGPPSRSSFSTAARHREFGDHLSAEQLTPRPVSTADAADPADMAVTVRDLIHANRTLTEEVAVLRGKLVAVQSCIDEEVHAIVTNFTTSFGSLRDYITQKVKASQNQPPTNPQAKP